MLARTLTSSKARARKLARKLAQACRGDLHAARRRRAQVSPPSARVRGKEA